MNLNLNIKALKHHIFAYVGSFILVDLRMIYRYEQNAPGLQACLSALFLRGKDAFGFVLLFRQAHFMAQRLVFSFCDTAWRSALFLLFSVSPEQY